MIGLLYVSKMVPSKSLRLDCVFIYFFTYFCFLFLHT